MYVKMDSSRVTMPMTKNMKAVVLGGASNVRTSINARAVKMPPKAWPLTTADMYSDGKSPAIPNKPPDMTAEQTGIYELIKI